MKCSHCSTAVTKADRWLSGVIGLEAALILECLFILTGKWTGLSLGIREGISVAIGILVFLFCLFKANANPCPGCPHLRQSM
ncbi:MAG: hypothetical protein M0Z65_08310 [Firmicutes bacterium]|uniref:Uncharacterized protein n=1 Tax=Melghirimyces thermohalophilus TaxID=1236220 RepID=A0A1G6LAZ2_9BACL|nr:hypothetical protein [Melghirimyces thermohalophilus]MDA8353170.1 hypothetical protein [Bacillota bacterium]SDC40612.1 hypothetical protein SAMN04488112_107152 [Melghirimyces thermohalophilus]